jgi:hypothetical protein
VSYAMSTGACSPGIKRPEREAPPDQRLRMSSVTPPLSLFVFITCAGGLRSYRVAADTL